MQKFVKIFYWVLMSMIFIIVCYFEHKKDKLNYFIMDK